jgi:hypothetical protein
MTSAIWQSKNILKSQKQWQKPKWLGNRPKGMSKEDWEIQVKEWKLDKLIVLDRVPKISKKKEFSSREDQN